MAKKRKFTDTRKQLPAATPHPALSSGRFGSFAEIVENDLRTLGGTYVSESTLRGIPAMEHCIQKIANAVASMSPLEVFEEDDITKVTPCPPIAKRPNRSQTTFRFWHDVVSTVQRRGNFVGILAFDGMGIAEQVVPVNNDFVTCYIDDAGYTVFEIMGTVFSSEEVVHVPGPHRVIGDPWALSPVQAYRMAISEQAGLQTYGESSFRTGSVPSMVIQLDRPEVPTELARQVQSNWIANHGGVRRPAVIPKSLSIEKMSWSPEDAEFIEAKRISIAEAALIMGFAPEDLGASLGNSMTYANITDRSIARITDVYQPQMRMIEEAWSDLIPGEQICRFDPERTLRMSPMERARLQMVRIKSGVSTPDEERSIEGKPPLPKPEPIETLPPGGDKTDAEDPAKEDPAAQEDDAL